MRNIVIVYLISLVLPSCASEAEKGTVVELPQLESIVSPVDSVSAEPYLITGNNGAVYLSWITKDSADSKLKYAVYKEGKWSSHVVIASGNDWFVNWADYPVFAINVDGSMMSHFLQKSEQGNYTYDVKFITSSDTGNTWTTPTILHDDGKKAEHGFVSIVPYEQNFFVSWLDGRNAASEEGEEHHGGHQGQMTIRAAIIDRTGKKLKEWELDGRVCDCCQTSAAITSSGPVVVYRDRSDSEIRDMSIVRLVNGEWTPPQPVFSDNWKIEGCPVNGPRICAQGNTVAVAWFSAPDKNAQVNVVFSHDGGATFSKPIKVNDDKPTGRVDIELLNENSAMVSWMEGAVIKAAQLYDDGRKDSSIVIASTSESRSSGFPQMTKANDKIIFAWTDDKAKTIKLASLKLNGK